MKVLTSDQYLICPEPSPPDRKSFIFRATDTVLGSDFLTDDGNVRVSTEEIREVEEPLSSWELQVPEV